MMSHNSLYMYIQKKSMKQVNKNILYEKVGVLDLQAIGGVKSKKTRSYQKGKCNSPIFSTETIYAYTCAIIIGLLHFPF